MRNTLFHFCQLRAVKAVPTVSGCQKMNSDAGDNMPSVLQLTAEGGQSNKEHATLPTCRSVLRGAENSLKPNCRVS